MLRLPPPPSLRPALGYALALGLPVVALLGSLQLEPYVHVIPFALFFPGVVAVAYLAGSGPGVLSAALSIVLVNGFIMLPHPAWSPRPETLVASGMFLLVSSFLVLAAGALRAGYADRAAHERRFRTFVASSGQMIWTAAPDGRFVEDSPSWRAFTGQRPEEYLGMGWLDAVHPDDRAAAARSWLAAVARRAPYEAEYRLRRPDGSYTSTLARAAPVLDGAGRVVEWIGVNADRSAQQEAELALRDSEARFRTLVETIPQMVYTSTARGEADSFNPQLLAYTGLDAAALSGEGWMEIVHPDDRARAYEQWSRMVISGEPGTGEYRLRRHDGVHGWFLVSAVPLRAPDGRVLKWFGTCTDIAAQKESERVMTEGIAARDVFLSVASHELKTPITAALLQVQHVRRLARDPSLPAALAERLVATEAAIERLGKLVEALLDVSRIATGRLALAHVPFDLSAAVAQVAARLDEAAHRAGSRLELAVAPGVRAMGDPLRAEQVLVNLLSNAVKYGAGFPIEVAVRRAGDRAVLSVADHGIGIAPEDQERIFERFERATSSRHYGGLGLGLWIARQLVEASGGAIRVQSEPGHGATFTVELPAAAVEPPPERRPSA